MSTIKKGIKKSEEINEKIGYTIFELIYIEKKIKEFLTIKETNCTYQLTKNLLKIESIKKNYSKCIEKLEESFYKKDNDNKVIQYLVEPKNENGKQLLYYKFDSKGDHVIAKPGEQSAPLIDSNNEEYKEALKNFNEEIHEIKFHTISESKIMELMESGNPLDGIDISILFGNVIEIEPEKE